MNNNSNPKIMAVCGKGGVGKTTITAIMTKLLAEKSNLRTLVIDADPAAGLVSALGVEVPKTVADIREELISILLKGDEEDREDMVRRLDYEFFNALAEESGFALLSIGRPETGDCYCQVNSLLRDVIESLSSDFDLTLIDGEAGLEQVYREVMRSVDTLVLVSDMSARGIHTVSTIRDVAKLGKVVNCNRIGLVINRVKDVKDAEKLAEQASMELLGYISDDEKIGEYDLVGDSMLKLPDDAPSVTAVKKILEKLG